MTTPDTNTQAPPSNNSTPPERFPLTKASEVYAASAPLDFLVDGLITKGSVNLLVGEGGAKKTWVALDLAVCVAMGLPWLGFQTVQAPVLIVDEESGPRRLKRRLLETLNGHLIPQEDDPPIYFTSLAMADLKKMSDVIALHTKIIEIGAGLVIIDALADVMPGADENAVKDVQPFFMNLRRISEATQSANVTIHHSNKQNGMYRGSTAIKGAVDLMLMVESQPASRYINFNVDKARDIEPKIFTAMATWVQEPPQFYLTSTDTKSKKQLNKGQRFVLLYLLNNGNSTIDDVMNAADICAPATAKAAIYNLVDSKHVYRTDSGSSGGRGNKAEVDLTDDGRKLAEKLQ